MRVYVDKAKRPRFRNTSEVPDEFIKEVLRFVKPSGLGEIKVWTAKSRGGFYGRCYTADAYLKLHLPAPTVLKKPFQGAAYGAYMAWNACTFEEAAVALIAHEVRHVWQTKHPKGYRVWGSRGRFSERDADAFAIHKMREWRREKAPRIVAK